MSYRQHYEQRQLIVDTLPLTPGTWLQAASSVQYTLCKAPDTRHHIPSSRHPANTVNCRSYASDFIWPISRMDRWAILI